MPLIQTHVEYLLNDKLPTTYFQQVQGQIYVCDLEWVDFISYFPGMKPLIVRVERDKAFIASLERELKLFCAELNQIVNKIK